MTMTSCGLYEKVTNKTTFDKANLAVQSQLETRGFKAISIDSVVNNPDAKYSEHLDTYRFADSLGNTMKYSVTYNLGKSKKGDYLYRTMFCGCETSDPDDYERLCGDDDLFKPIKELPKERNVTGENLPGDILVSAILITLINLPYIGIILLTRHLK